MRRLFFPCIWTLLIGLALAVETVKYSYDSAGRLTAVSYSNGTTIAYTYDAAGNLLSRVVNTGTPPGGVKRAPDAVSKSLRKPITRRREAKQLTP